MVMWNSFKSDAPPAIVAGGVTHPVGGGESGLGYLARPDGNGPFPTILLIHHAPGWDEFYQEFARRFANHGYTALVPNLFRKFGPGTPDEVAAAARAAGGVADDDVIADATAALAWLKSQPTSNGKVGIIGSCSAGRHAVLVASRVPGFDAVVDLWGARVVATPDQLTPKQPVAPIDYIPNLNAPILGLFGNEDTSPSPAEVDQLEAALQQNNKTYQFQRYDGAGHGFFYYDRPLYRQQQAMDGWAKVFTFFDQYLKA
jgi:carboxymethylenebutenolidase